MTTATLEKLALHGGPRTVPEGTILPWPPKDASDRDLVLASLNGTNHAFGPNCIELQKEFAAWNGSRFAIATNSGTAALHMAIAACGCGTADEVLVPAYSWSSSATCILHHSCIPIFVDIDFDTMLIDPAKLEEKISPRTKAIVAVHLHGLSADMDPILAVARKHGLKVIEDACQAHGALYKGKKVGTLGDCAAFSFNQNKCLSAGEGGMFVTEDETLHRNAQQLWSFGETRAPSESRDFHAYALGWMYRTSDLPAAFARAQLRKLDGYLAHQRRAVSRLTEQLAGVGGLLLPPQPDGRVWNGYNYVIRLDTSRSPSAQDAAAYRDRVVKALQAEGVPATVWQKFILPSMTVFRAQNGFGAGHPWSHPLARPVVYDPAEYPIAQRHCDTHFCIINPLRMPNGDEAVDAVARGIHKVMANLSNLD
ncbi:MAG: hypothetical protein AMXMBFR7_39130 [Planctomycetota bacterium]